MTGTRRPARRARNGSGCLQDGDVEELAGLVVLGQMDLSTDEQCNCALVLASLRSLKWIASDAGTSMDDLTPELVIRLTTGRKVPDDVVTRMAQEIEAHGPTSTESLLEFRQVAARLLRPADAPSPRERLRPRPSPRTRP